MWGNALNSKLLPKYFGNAMLKAVTLHCKHLSHIFLQKLNGYHVAFLPLFSSGIVHKAQWTALLASTWPNHDITIVQNSVNPHAPCPNPHGHCANHEFHYIIKHARYMPIVPNRVMYIWGIGWGSPLGPAKMSEQAAKWAEWPVPGRFYNMWCSWR